MQPMAVVKHGYILQYILLGFIASLVVSPLDPFLLKATKEAFHNGIDAPMSSDYCSIG